MTAGGWRMGGTSLLTDGVSALSQKAAYGTPESLEHVRLSRDTGMNPRPKVP